MQHEIPRGSSARGAPARTRIPGWRSALVATGALIAIWHVAPDRARADVTIPVGITDTPPGIVDVGTLTVLGTLNVNAGDTVDVGALSVDGGILVANAALIKVAGVSTATAGEINIGAGGSFVVGDFNLLKDIDNTPSQMTVETGGVVSTAAATVNGSLVLVYGGEFTAAGPLNIVQSGVMQVRLGATVDVQGATTLDHGALFVQGAFTSIGPVLVTNGNLFIAPLEPGAGGVFTAHDTTTIAESGVLGIFPGTYNAIGALTVKDDGVLNIVDGNGLPGILNASGPTTISDNALVVFSDGGTFNAAQPITLTGGSLVGKEGNINGTVDNQGGTVGGHLAGSSGSFAGTLYIAGAYKQASGGTFRAGIRAEGASDLLAVSGRTTLAGHVSVVTFGPFAVGDQVRIIATDRTISGMFGTAALEGDIGSLTAVVLKTDDAGSYKPRDGNNVDVLFVDPAAVGLGLTGNQAAVAEALVGDLPVGGIVIAHESFLAGILGMLSDPNILEQVGPESYDSFTAFSFETARVIGGLIDTRLRGLRCAAGGGRACGGASGLFASDRRDPVLIADATTGAVAAGGPDPHSARKPPSGGTPGAHPSGWAVWASGVGAGLWKNRTSDNLGYSGWTTGGVAGVDLSLARGFVLGVLAGATRSNIAFDGVSGEGGMDSVTTGVYAAWHGHRLFANAAFTYTKNWVEADRDITFLPDTRTANGKTEGDQYAVHATMGTSFRLRRLSIEASGGLDWVSLRQHGFTETGAGALNLTVDSRTDDSLRLRAGVRLVRAFRVRPGFVLVPSVRVGYAREMFDTTRPITASLTDAGGSFTVTGDDGGRDFVTFGGGVQAVWSQGLTLFFSHAGEWAQDRNAHSFTGGVKFSW